jgi:serine/threonine protein kinase
VQGDEGRDIAGFRIESEIGRGGMGIVYLAQQSFPERKVALKLLSPELASDPAFRERFVYESNAAASTEHPNIVPVYGAGEADGQLYLAMRYIEGTDLGSLLGREGAISPDRAAQICSEIADALEAAHDRGLIHRDVKPGNILLDSRGRAYLTDFGLIRRTRLHTEITKTGQFMGTVDYCAPEQIKGGEIDGRVDVYSLGCVLFECLTGAPPFRRETEVATLYAHLEDPAQVPSALAPAVSAAFDAVVSKAMAKRQDERFATAGELGAAIRAAAQPQIGRNLKPFPERRRWSRYAATAAASLVLLTIVAFMVTKNRTETPEQSATSAAPPLNSVIQVEAESGDILTTAKGIPSGAGFGLPKVEVGEGGVWVLAAINVVMHVDPSTGRIVDTKSIGNGFTPTESMAVWSRTVWVGAAPGVIRINPATDQELRSVPLEGGSASATYVAAGGRDLWAVNGGQLTRLDGLGRRVGSADIGLGSMSGIGVGLDGVWIVDDLQGTLSKVDPDTLRVLEVAAVSGNIDAIAVGAGSVWIADSTAGVVTPFDPTSLAAGSPVRVGVHPTDVAVGLGAVWVSNQGDGTISRIDPVTHNVDTIPVGAPAAAIAVDDVRGALWVVIAPER